MNCFITMEIQFLAQVQSRTCTSGKQTNLECHKLSFLCSMEQDREDKVRHTLGGRKGSTLKKLTT